MNKYLAMELNLIPALNLKEMLVRLLFVQEGMSIFRVSLNTMNAGNIEIEG